MIPTYGQLSLTGPFYHEHNEDSPKRLSARFTFAIFLKLRAVPRAIPEPIKGDQDSYPLQNPLRSVVDSIFLADEKNRNPRQVNKKQW
jgi:hypothetical protein